MKRRRATMRAGKPRAAAIGVLAVAAAAALTLLPARTAEANPMDLAPERLTLPCAPITSGTTTVECGTGFTPTTGNAANNYYRPDNAAWAKLVTQYGLAIAPPAMHPARTTGYGGFEFSLFGVATTVSKDEDFMKRGTEGAITNNQFPKNNSSPDGVLQVYGITGRKGLPYGFEIQGSVGYIANTEMTVLGGGIRLSPFEGFRKGALGVIPDISVGGYVNTLAGTNKVKMTVPALDVQVSKPFTIANQLIIQPYIGWQMIWIDADSGVVDGTPKNDGLKNCNARPATPKEQTAGDQGEFHCQTPGATYSDAPGGSKEALAKLDLNNNMVFAPVRFRMQRLFFGLAFRYEIAHLLIHAMTNIGDPTGDNVERVSGLAKQWTIGVMTGVSW